MRVRRGISRNQECMKMPFIPNIPPPPNTEYKREIEGSYSTCLDSADPSSNELLNTIFCPMCKMPPQEAQRPSNNKLSFYIFETKSYYLALVSRDT